MATFFESKDALQRCWSFKDIGEKCKIIISQILQGVARGLGKWMLAQEFGLWKLLLGEMRQFPMWAAGPDLVPHNSGQKTQETSNPQRLGSGNSQHRQKKGLDKWVLVMWAAGLEPFCGLFSEQLSHFINILKTPEIILFLATKRRHKILTSGASHGRDEVYLESWVSFRNKTPVDI